MPNDWFQFVQADLSSVHSLEVLYSTTKNLSKSGVAKEILSLVTDGYDHDLVRRTLTAFLEVCDAEGQVRHQLTWNVTAGQSLSTWIKAAVRAAQRYGFTINERLSIEGAEPTLIETWTGATPWACPPRRADATALGIEHSSTPEETRIACACQMNGGLLGRALGAAALPLAALGGKTSIARAASLARGERPHDVLCIRAEGIHAERRLGTEVTATRWRIAPAEIVAISGAPRPSLVADPVVALRIYCEEDTYELFSGVSCRVARELRAKVVATLVRYMGPISKFQGLPRE